MRLYIQAAQSYWDYLTELSLGQHPIYRLKFIHYITKLTFQEQKTFIKGLDCPVFVCNPAAKKKKSSIPYPVIWQLHIHDLMELIFDYLHVCLMFD